MSGESVQLPEVSELGGAEAPAPKAQVQPEVGRRPAEPGPGRGRSRVLVRMGEPVPEALDREGGQEAPGGSTVPQLHDGTILMLSLRQPLCACCSVRLPRAGGPGAAPWRVTGGSASPPTGSDQASPVGGASWLSPGVVTDRGTVGLLHQLPAMY